MWKFYYITGQSHHLLKILIQRSNQSYLHIEKKNILNILWTDSKKSKMEIIPSYIFHNSQIALEISLRRLKLSLRQLRLHLSLPLYLNEELCNSSEEFHKQISMQLCFVNAQISTCETSIRSLLFQKKQQLHEIPYKAPRLKSSHCSVPKLILAYF